MRSITMALVSLLACGAPAAGEGPGDDPCDADGDGHQAIECGGADCCDDDARARPGQSAWSDEPTACGGWDYSCDGEDEPRDVTLQTCADAPGDLACKEGQIGWLDEVPACGEAANFAQRCARDPDLGVCVPADVEPRLQPCR